MTVEKEIIQKIEEYDTIIIHRHNIQIQMLMDHKVDWQQLLCKAFPQRRYIK